MPSVTYFFLKKKETDLNFLQCMYEQNYLVVLKMLLFCMNFKTAIHYF